ncbi:MAG: dephospho-CoA kinase [Bacteroidota bacterium]|jgi:dephospho-CoA kinase
MKPRLVGITGGIGSGKSTISKCLQTMGYLVFNADDQASIALDHNLEVVQYVKDLLGNEAYHVNGKANRAFIASKVFSDSQLLKQLNTVLHPVVRNMFDDWVAAHKGEKILFKEAAILFESGANKQVDEVIGVIAPESVRLRRVMKRDNRSEKEILDIMARQMNQDELSAKCQHIIINDDHTPVMTALLELLKKLEG